MKIIKLQLIIIFLIYLNYLKKIKTFIFQQKKKTNIKLEEINKKNFNEDFSKKENLTEEKKEKTTLEDKKKEEIKNNKKKVIKGNINNLKSINFKTIEISENEENNNKKETLIKKKNKKVYKKIIIESLNYSNSISIEQLNKIKKKDIINPEEQHFLCVTFQHKLKYMNSLIN